MNKRRRYKAKTRRKRVRRGTDWLGTHAYAAEVLRWRQIIDAVIARQEPPR